MSPKCDVDFAALFKSRVFQIAPRTAWFDAADYIALNADLAAVEPHDHFANFGVWEGRSAVKLERFTAKLSRAVILGSPSRPTDEALRRGYRGAMTVSPTLHLPLNADHKDRSIAARLIEAFDTVGVEAQIIEGAPKPDERDAILISPDRIFQGARADADLQIYAASIAVASHDAQRLNASRDLPYLLGAAGVIATDAETSALFQAAGVPAIWLGGAFFHPTGGEAEVDHPLTTGLSRDIRRSPAYLPWSKRPIDVLAVEPASPERTNAWGRMADGMARFRTVVYQPPAGAACDEVEVALRRYLYARSKIVLHLHDAAPSAMSGVMIEEAAAAGAALLSEPGPPHPIIKPGQDYFEASARRMPELVETLLSSDDGRARAAGVVETLRRNLVSKFDLELTGLSLINLLLDAAERP